MPEFIFKLAFPARDREAAEGLIAKVRQLLTTERVEFRGELGDDWVQEAENFRPARRAANQHMTRGYADRRNEE